MKLPYFEGDYWPRIIDECIVSAEKDEEIDKRKQQEESSNISDDDTFQTDDGMPVKKQQKSSSSKKKNNLKKSAQNNKKKGGLITGNPVVDRLFQQLEKHRDVFFTIKLFSPQDEQIVIRQKPKIEDPDPLISCELMDTRDNFLGKSREEHWEYSQLRRSKWSTLNFCYTLHTQEQDKALPAYTCNMCEQPAQYHCGTCEVGSFIINIQFLILKQFTPQKLFFHPPKPFLFIKKIFGRGRIRISNPRSWTKN